MSYTDTIVEISVKDVRFPTSLEGDGSDAVNKSPDYSCSYVTLVTDSGSKGYGITFTCGRGNEIVCQAIEMLSSFVTNRCVGDIFGKFGSFWQELATEDQIRWLGPEKGVIHLALAAVVNALWDLWAKIEKKPLWKLLSDMDPEKLVSTIDFRYLDDALTKNEAIEILKSMEGGKKEREKLLLKNGYPAYTTSCGWLGYSDEKIERLCNEAKKQGFKRFKMKVGADLSDDQRRASLLRKTMDAGDMLMMDANQKWEVQEAIDWMKELSAFNVTWIEEPTSPDDVLGHAKISKALAPLGIGVATGEHCQNRIMFKQFLTSGAMQFCQIDSCRLGSVNENLAVILMAKKFNVPVCPHGGGVGLCEYIQHLAMFDFIAVSGTMENRVTEFVDHLHEHFVDPCVVENGQYLVPQAPGYSIEMLPESVTDHEFPNGKVWRKLVQEGLYKID